MRAYYPETGLAIICGLFGLSRQAFYYHQRETQRVELEEEIILEMVFSIRQKHPRKGVRKIYELITPELYGSGIKFGRDALFDLLSRHGLLIRRRKRKVATTQSHHWLKKYPNLMTG